MFCSFFVFAGGVRGADKAILMNCFVSHRPLSCKCGRVSRERANLHVVTLRCVQSINLETTEEMERETTSEAFHFFFFGVVEKKIGSVGMA